MRERVANFHFEEWPDWFVNHVHTMDNTTAGFIRQQDDSICRHLDRQSLFVTRRPTVALQKLWQCR